MGGQSGQITVHALGFDDVIVLPGLSSVEPHEVDISGKASRSVKLHIPLLSSPMDTVTEWRMAVVLALKGALGVVHRNMSIEDQVEQLRRVKQHPLIRLSSVSVPLRAECCYVLDQMRRHGLRRLPVVDEPTGRLRGYVHYHSLLGCRCGEPIAKHVEPGKWYSLSEWRDALRIVARGEADAVAIVEDGVFVGTVTVNEALEEYRPLTDEDGRLRVAAAVSPLDLERASRLEKYADVLVSDVAHFHNRNVLSSARRLVSMVSADFVAGNLGSYEGVVDTITTVEAVAGLRMGIAGGSICTTSGVTGVAAPTLYAVMEAARALRDHGIPLDKIPIIADGGIRGAGDALKALAAGASAVMAGYMLAGTDETPAPLIRVGDRLYKPYRGMASKGAMERRFAADRYTTTAKKVEEGVEGLVPYRGPASRIIDEFAEALRAGMGYAGARSLKELWGKARLAIITSRIGAYQNLVRTSL
ncbi:MAG: IMP dehydrogenase [Pyrodictiaceae archaeon]